MATVILSPILAMLDLFPYTCKRESCFCLFCVDLMSSLTTSAGPSSKSTYSTYFTLSTDSVLSKLSSLFYRDVAPLESYSTSESDSVSLVVVCADGACVVSMVDVSAVVVSMICCFSSSAYQAPLAVE